MNIVTRGLGKLSRLLTRGFGKTLTIIITPVQPTGGGGQVYYQELEPHPFRLIETKAIVVPIRKPNINVKVTIEELDVNAELDFMQYNKIRIIFRGIE